VFGCQVIFLSESVPGASMTFHVFSVCPWQGSLASFTTGLLQFYINLRCLLSTGRRAQDYFENEFHSTCRVSSSVHDVKHCDLITHSQQMLVSI